MSALVAGGAQTTVAASEETSGPSDRPRIGLVLSGGGARGAAHVGVLEVLEELRVPVDCIAGTSMGSIVGGLYASGMSPEQLRAAITGTDWVSMFQDRPDRSRRYFRRKQDDVDFPVRYQLHLDGKDARLPLGVLQGQRLSNRLERFEETLGAADDFDRLPIPFRAVATDLDTGEPLVIDGGSLARALRASMSIPGVFRPVEIDGRLYVDGGVVANLPVGILKSEFDVDVVLAVDISTPLREQEIESYLAVLRRMLRFLTQGNVARDRALLGPGDVLLVPDLRDIATADFERSAEAIDVGRVAAEAISDELARFSVSEERYRRFLARQRRLLRAPPVITGVVVTDSGPVRPGIVEAFVAPPLGEPLDTDRLERDLVRLHGLGLHDPIEYGTVGGGPEGGSLLRIRAPKRRVGLTTLQFGLQIEDDFEGGDSYTISVRHQMLAVNRRAAEWRNDVKLGDVTGIESEFYQPVDRRLRYFVAPRVSYAREDAPLSVQERTLALVEVSVGEAGLDLGRNLGSWGQLRAGFARTSGRAEISVGLPLAEPIVLETARWNVALRFDTLDSPTWPARGGLGGVEWSRYVEDLGGDREGEEMEVRADWAFSIGRVRLVPGVEASFDLGDASDPAATADLGGLFRLSGYGPFELIGNEAVLGRLVAYGRLNRSVLRILPAGWYAGVSVEAGNVFETDQSIEGSDLLYGGTLFFGANTPLGAMIFGYGVAEPGRDRFYLSFGRSFF